MKKILITILISGSLFCAEAVLGQGEGTVQQICIGTGSHCATLKYGNITMNFVKDRLGPGILIKEVKG